MNQCSFIVPEVHLEPNAIGVLDDGSNGGIDGLACMQIDVLGVADVELAVWLVLLCHGESIRRTRFPETVSTPTSNVS